MSNDGRIMFKKPGRKSVVFSFNVSEFRHETTILPCVHVGAYAVFEPRSNIQGL